MTRSPPEDYEGAFIDLDEGPFVRSHLEAIVEEVRYPLAPSFDIDQLLTELRVIGQAHRLDLQLAAVPTVSGKRKYLQDLRRASRTMVKLVPLLPGASAEFPPEPSTGLMQLLGHPMQAGIDARVAEEEAKQAGSHRRAQQSVAERRVQPEHIFGDAMPIDILVTFHEINRLVEAAADRALKDLGQTEGHDRLNPDEDCVVLLMNLYQRAFDRDIAFARPGGSTTAGGPMIRFVAACCKVLGITLKPDSIARIKQRRFPGVPDISA